MPDVPVPQISNARSCDEPTCVEEDRLTALQDELAAQERIENAQDFGVGAPNGVGPLPCAADGKAVEQTSSATQGRGHTLHLKFRKVLDALKRPNQRRIDRPSSGGPT